MLKIKVREEHNSEPQMELWLEQDGDYVNLRAKDRNGKDWTILVVDIDGITLIGGIEAMTGWPITSVGKLKLVK